MLSALLRSAVAVCLLTTTSLVAQQPWVVTFDGHRVDQVPDGFTLASMRQSDAGRWLIRRSGDDNCLQHRADVSATGFALAVADRTVPEDLAVSVRVRFGGPARSGGLVWRFRDDQNYHSLLLDLNRSELAVYRIIAGNRIRLDMRDELELDPAAWHALKVVHIDHNIRVMLGGVRVFDEHDRRADRGGDGQVGLIATGASEICFDDLSVEAKRSRR